MEGSSFRIFSSSPFDRSLKRLVKKHAEVLDIFDDMVVRLSVDPRNQSRRYDIKKLECVAEGDGQWRIRSGVYRLRYDVEDDKVNLHSINHRREAY